MVPPGKNPSAASSGADASELREAGPIAQPWFRAVRVLRALEDGPHAACKLVFPTGMNRAEVNSGIAFLKRRRLVEHLGAWRLTDVGKMALNANKRFLKDLADGPKGQGKPVDAVPRSGGTPPLSPSQPQSQETM